MKELSIADLIALERYCDDLMEHTNSSETIDYLFTIMESCNAEIDKRMQKIYESSL
jgi:hypothetical protein